MEMHSYHGQVLLIPGTKRTHIFFVPVNIFLHPAMFKFNIPFSTYAPKTYKLFIKSVSSSLAFFLVGDATMLVTSVKYYFFNQK